MLMMWLLQQSSQIKFVFDPTLTSGGLRWHNIKKTTCWVSEFVLQNRNLLSQYESSGSANGKGAGLWSLNFWLPVSPTSTWSLRGRRENISGSDTRPVTFLRIYTLAKSPSSSQLHKLLENTECDMIRAVQRRINGELTLVASEQRRQETGLPTGTENPTQTERNTPRRTWGATISVSCVWTELWKKVPLKYTLSPERPQVVETFVQQLMEGAEEAEGQVRSNQIKGPLCDIWRDLLEQNGTENTKNK